MSNLPVPAPASAVTSITMTSAFWNAQVRDAINYMINPPICQVYGNANQSISATTWTLISLNTVVADSYNAFNTTTHQYAAPVAGWYEVFGNVPVLHQASAFGWFAGLYKNGSAVTNASGGAINSTSIDGISASIGWQIFCNAGDTLDLRTWFSAAGTAFSNGLQAPNLNLRWIHA